jgi:hypothetical protein
MLAAHGLCLKTVTRFAEKVAHRRRQTASRHTDDNGSQTK